MAAIAGLVRPRPRKLDISADPLRRAAAITEAKAPRFMAP